MKFIDSETIVDSLWEPLIVLDSRLCIKSANRAFCNFFKVTSDEIRDRLIYDLGNGQWNFPKLRKLLEELLVKNDSFENFEMTHDFPKIGIKLMVLNAHKIIRNESEGGKKDEVVILAFQDITAQRFAEDELNRVALVLSYSNNELEHFAATAAHDLRSPLNKIQIFAERLLDESPSEKAKSYLISMIKSSQRMSNLVESLLKISRISSEAHQVERVPLAGIIKDVVSDFELPIKGSGAVIKHEGLPVMMANRSQMHQLFQNLIGNSIKYRKSNEAPRVSIVSRLTPEAAEITVKDNGIGFDEKHSLEIFKPFKRLHGNSEYEGSGIGLALCQKIVRLHGGEITAKSKPGEGSVFTIQWPIGILCHAAAQ